MAVRVGDWVGVLDGMYDPSWAAEWDAVGLVTGDPAAEADSALFTVDFTEPVLDEAVEHGCRLVVAHHPLLLRGVHGVAESTPKGRLVSRLVREGIALFVAHTNADVAPDGVSDALAAEFGLLDVEPLAPSPPDERYKLVTFVPPEHAEKLLDALADAGAGTIGDYDRCAWTTGGTGTFDARPIADPTVGEPGERTATEETRVETVLPRSRAADVVAALVAAHPYEEPAYDLIPVDVPNGRGFGRVGRLHTPMQLSTFASMAQSVLGSPVRVAGAERLVSRVAVCGGAGDAFVGDAERRGADVYLTADLRHHVTLEAAERGLATVDAGHAATERPWVRFAAPATLKAMDDRGHLVTTRTSAVMTDPWIGRNP